MFDDTLMVIAFVITLSHRKMRSRRPLAQARQRHRRTGSRNSHALSARLAAVVTRLEEIHRQLRWGVDVAVRSEFESIVDR